jgi:hypothetical protein
MDVYDDVFIKETLKGLLRNERNSEYLSELVLAHISFFFNTKYYKDSSNNIFYYP